MVRATETELQQRYDRAIALINLRPGIALQSLSIHLGLTKRTRQNLMTWLRSHKEIQVLEPDKLHGSVRFYPAGHKLPDQRLFEPSRSKELTQCRIYSVPLEDLHQFTQTPTSEPTRSVIADIPTATEWRDSQLSITERPMMINSRQRAVENRRQMTTAITQMVESGELTNRHQLCLKVGVSTNYFASNPDMQQLYDEAAAQLDPSNSGESSTNPIELLQQVEELQQRNQELEQRARELRQQLQTVQQPISAEQVLLLRLQGEVDFWQGQICQYRQQQQEMEVAIARAKITIDVLNDLIEREQFQAQADSNGNGKEAIATGGQQCS